MSKYLDKITFLIFVSSAIMLIAGNASAGSGDEKKDPEKLIAALGPGSNVKDLDAFLEFDRAKIVKMLVKELEPIAESPILPAEKSKRTEQMHQIWIVRTLRFLTGLDFDAPVPKDLDDPDRMQFLSTPNEDRITFFGVWMSRDIIYVAPKKAQKNIIKQWKEWADQKADIFNYPPPPELWSTWFF